METYFSWKRRMERHERVQRRWEIVKEILGGIMVIGIMFVFGALCVLGSGYHWE